MTAQTEPTLDADPHELGAKFVCTYCGNKMIEPYISCCGEIHFIPEEEDEQC